MNSDFKDLLRTCAEEGVEYLVVGAYAVIHHSQPRYTKDLDIWVRPSEENAQRVARAFARFGIPLIEVTESDFAQEGLQFAIGVAPTTISLSNMKAIYTRTQGQYLAFIHYYTKLNRRAPAEADFRNHFDVTPPTVHQMIVRLEQRGFISRIPGQPRSIELLIAAEKLPPLD